MIEKIESVTVELLTKAHNSPGWGVHVLDTYEEFSRFSGINITQPKDLYIKVNEALIEKFIDKRIESYKLKVTLIGGGTGILGGPVGVAGFIVDLEEYLRAIYNLSQEIGYVYGILPNPFSFEKIESDRKLFFESISKDTLKAMAIGLGASSVSFVSKEIFKAIAKKEAKEILNKKISEKLITQLAKEVGKLLGKQLTKKAISQGALRFIPIIGGVVAGAINYKSFEMVGKNLKEGLKKEREILKEIILNSEN